MNITRDNYEYPFFLYLEGEMSDADRRAVEAFAEANPDLKEELELCQGEPDLDGLMNDLDGELESGIAENPILTMPDKESLLKSEAAVPSQIRIAGGWLWKAIAAVACVALVLLVSLPRLRQQEDPIMAQSQQPQVPQPLCQSDTVTPRLQPALPLRSTPVAARTLAQVSPQSEPEITADTIVERPCLATPDEPLLAQNTDTASQIELTPAATPHTYHIDNLITYNDFRSSAAPVNNAPQSVPQMVTAVLPRLANFTINAIQLFDNTRQRWSVQWEERWERMRPRIFNS